MMLYLNITCYFVSSPLFLLHKRTNEQIIDKTGVLLAHEVLQQPPPLFDLSVFIFRSPALCYLQRARNHL